MESKSVEASGSLSAEAGSSEESQVGQIRLLILEQPLARAQHRSHVRMTFSNTWSHFEQMQLVVF